MDRNPVGLKVSVSPRFKTADRIACHQGGVTQKIEARCPTCGQYYHYVRVGVNLTSLKAMIFDKVKAAFGIGVTSQEIMDAVYFEHERPRQLAVIRTHIGQINDLLEEVDWVIVSDGRGRNARWTLRQRLRGKGIRRMAKD
jgi:hypothetical protein